ncbi:hypothetical protein BDN67DRAFT_967525 [Paxillus ammoniavirescens]|nr:hypothetical protein BDN67DRAFT_967525 [Paxillus ammoniavirescens]
MSDPAHQPTIVHHSPKIPLFVSAPNIAHSAVGGAHYSGVPTIREPKRGRTSSGEATRSSHESPEASRERIMNDLKELYCCRPTRSIFERTWRPDAVFEDPLVKAEGRGEYEPQWFAMPKIFSKSETISSRVMLSTESPNRFVFSQVQEYTLRFIGKKQRIESVIVVDLDESDKITRMVEKWNGDELPTHYGAYFLRRVNAQVTPWLVKVPKE